MSGIFDISHAAEHLAKVIKHNPEMTKEESLKELKLCLQIGLMEAYFAGQAGRRLAEVFQLPAGDKPSEASTRLVAPPGQRPFPSLK